MKKIFRKPYLIFGLIVSMFIGGCYSELSDLEIGNLQWSPELGFPLVNSEFTLTDILEADVDGFEYTTDGDNTIVIILNDDSLFSQSATDYFSLSDQSLNVPPLFLTQSEIDLFNANGQVTVSREVNVDFPNQGDLTEILINQGTINLQLDENFPAIVDLSLGVRDPFGSDMLDYSNEFNYVSGGNAVSNDQASDDYNNLRFIYNSDPALSQISLNYNMVLTRVDQDLVLGENSLDLFFNFNDQEFEALYGNLPPQDISTENNTIETDFFNQDGALSELNYEFNRPQFKLIFTNSMGLPIRFDVSNLRTYRDGVPTEEPINGAINLAAAPEGGGITTGEQEFNDSFKDIINNVPDSVSLAIDGAIDPNDELDNFVFGDSYIQVGYEIEIPLELRLSGLEFNETIELEGIDPAGLQYALFKFTSENSLPIDLNFKADFLDADSTVLFTLFDGAFLKGGTVENPTVIGDRPEDLIRLPEDGETDLDFLKNVDRIGISATVSTTNSGNDMVKISADAAVKFNLAVQTKYNVNLD
jgi:hypothetical protein